MATLFIIADDYTGALDTGVQFAKSGANVYVTTYEGLCMPYSDILAAGYDVLVVDAESRHLQKNLAATRVAELVRAALLYGFTYIYKKTDSALRGNIGAELGAMSVAAGCASIAFAPAYPKSGRITVGGIHYIDGIPVGESVFAHDPYAPIKCSEVAKIVGEQTNIRVISYPVSSYGSDGSDSGSAGGGGGGEGYGGKHSRQMPQSMLNDGAVIEIYDARTDSDLANLGHYLKECGKLRYLAGCAGFAGILSEIYELGPFSKTSGNASAVDTVTIESKLPERFIADQSLSKGLLLVTGSVNPITLKQLTGAGNTAFKTIVLTPEQKLGLSAKEQDASTDMISIEVAKAVAAALQAHGKVILAAATSMEDIKRTDSVARKHGIDMEEIRYRICKNIGKITSILLRRNKIGALAVFGGDTLHEIIKQSEIPAIAPIRELAQGIVEAYIISEEYDTKLITKSGGLGDENTLTVIIDYYTSIISKT